MASFMLPCIDTSFLQAVLNLGYDDYKFLCQMFLCIPL